MRVIPGQPRDRPTGPTLGNLWRQFLPLSVSDVTMAASDPLMTTTLAHLPGASTNLAAVGVAKSLAVVFESPIIMLLHASNALAPSPASRAALWRFMLVTSGGLSLLLALLVVPPVFETFARWALALEGPLVARAHAVLSLMVLWPLAIGWRRYFQGLLIRDGRSASVARAGFLRLGAVGATLAMGYAAAVPGAMLAGAALVVGVLVEAAAVTLAAWSLRFSDLGERPATSPSESLPTDLRGVSRFYWPLANSMVVVWCGRAVLVALVARSVDGSVALAAWPAAWGLVLVLANATRMVQQVVIRNRESASRGRLLTFAASVGLACSALLVAVGATPAGRFVVDAFVGNDDTLASAVRPVLVLCALVPTLVALQNAVQGLLIGDGRTGRVNGATWLGTGVLLLVAWLAVLAGVEGATAAAGAMTAALAAETACLTTGLRSMSGRSPGTEMSPSAA